MDGLEKGFLYGYCGTCGSVREVAKTVDTPTLTRLALVCSYDRSHPV